MLSLFPSLLTWSLLGPFLLRLTIGIVFAYAGYRKFKSKQTNKDTCIAALNAIIGILFIIGLYTQLAALVACVIMAYLLVKKIRGRQFFTDGVNYYFILLIISLSILLTGPGAFAFDLPL